jgi:hypothetical protein
MTKSKYVDVTVDWADGVVVATVKIPIADWEEIRKGKKYVECTNYWYEGRRFTAGFHFNSPKKGGLRVTYNDGGEGFIGEISEAIIKGGEI